MFCEALGLYRLPVGCVQVNLVGFKDRSSSSCHSVKGGKRQYGDARASVHQSSQRDRCCMRHHEGDHERRTLIYTRFTSRFLMIDVIAFELLGTQTNARGKHIHHHTGFKTSNPLHPLKHRLALVSMSSES